MRGGPEKCVNIRFFGGSQFKFFSVIVMDVKAGKRKIDY